MAGKQIDRITSFRKSHGTQHFKIIMLEWNREIDKADYI